MMITQRHSTLITLLASVLLSACGSTATTQPEPFATKTVSQPPAAAAVTPLSDENRFDSSLTLMAPDGYAEEFFSIIGDDRIDLNIRMIDAYSGGDYWPQAAMIFYDVERVQFLACRLTQNDAGDLALSFARGDDESQVFELTATDVFAVDHLWFTEITLRDDHLILSSEGQDPWFLPLDFPIHEYSVRVSSSRSQFDISYPNLFEGD